MLIKALMTYYGGIFGSITYMLYRNMSCYNNKSDCVYLPQSGLLNPGTVIGAYLGYKIIQLYNGSK